ncbi:MAG: FAD-binding protein, partial [Anaerolineae bacterium]|nr:FAD-binding protein [Anaerolineae bacterium]
MIMGGGPASTQPYGGHRGLRMNKNGYRYGNEDINGPFAAVGQMHQPEMKAYCIWGSNYAEGAAPWYAFGMTRDADPIPPSAILSQWEGQANEGSLVKGDTIEEVIEKLGLPAEATKATIDRYNGFCEAGLDEQYYKRPELLVPIAEGPFYGGEVEPPSFLTVMGGLRTNLDMQVCDENDEPIPGLYNVGVMVGDYYANMYNFLVEGNNLGACCLTFGYVTGQGVAQGTI